MRAGAIIVLLGLTALGAYAVGRQDAATSRPSAATIPVAQSEFAKPMGLAATSVDAPAAATPTRPTTQATSPSETGSPAKSAPTAKPAQPDTRKLEAALTAAAIAAIIIKASRDQYHATGRPCACPDDTMRNGRSCGGRSAYSRPGGAAPLCYPSDVTAEMIEAYRRRTASR
ncbi:hypothetical protein CWO90_17510 [Bradyrhizobium sp. Leo121]|nr:hypothetical protein CWO90_17510 [Bradyrhizobium sp. Leo121]